MLLCSYVYQLPWLVLKINNIYEELSLVLGLHTVNAVLLPLLGI